MAESDSMSDFTHTGDPMQSESKRQSESKSPYSFFEQDSPFASMGTARVGEEFLLLLREYLRQQTVLPLRNLLRWVALGLAGAIFILVGVVMLTLGVLQMLQEQTGDVFDGSLRWLPYLMTVVAVLVLVAIVVMMMRKSPSGAPKA